MIVFMLHELDENKKKKKVIGKAEIDLGAMSSAQERKVHNVDRLMLVGKKKTYLYVTIQSCPKNLLNEQGEDDLSALSTFTGVDGQTDIVLDNEVDDDDEDLQLDELDDMRWKRISQQCETLKHQTALLNGTITLLEKDNTKLKEQLEEANAKLQAITNGSKTSETQMSKELMAKEKLIKEKEEELKRVKANLTKKEEEVAKLMTKNKGDKSAQHDAKKHQEEIEGLQRELEQEKKQKETINESHDQLVEELQKATKTIRNLMHSMDDATAKNIEFEKLADEAKVCIYIKQF